MATTAAVNPPAVKAAGGGYAAKCGGGSIFLNAQEKQTLDLHNQIRKNHNLRPFCVQPNLENAARAHSKDMIQRDYFSHDTKGTNETFYRRLERFGYKYRYCGENIAYGSGSYGEPGSIMRGWMNSPEHRHNILNGNYREIGIGTYAGNFNGNNGVTMYTADFGTRR